MMAATTVPRLRIGDTRVDLTNPHAFIAADSGETLDHTGAAMALPGRMLRIGEMLWGPFTIKSAGAASRPAGVYEKWMSGMLGKPVIGSLGGNVLRDFRITIDYPAGQVYLERTSHRGHGPLDLVGIRLTPSAQGGCEIAGTEPGVNGIHPGDRLLKIDGTNVVRSAYCRIVKLLGGEPGDTHRLVLSRDGHEISVKVTVVHLL